LSWTYPRKYFMSEATTWIMENLSDERGWLLASVKKASCCWKNVKRKHWKHSEL
jgi:hypothetical protein